ncbi:GreA/GreB family elongation factor [Cellulophaga fucicola]|uniref:Regulator of nucleoside diphosphate kinase n=1 Tax=Cellulophaga fucicola TaxID=76595 RepID=A0A1K1Q1G3_9FLAO|nr:GreA/GreB family elongation factor [Cellulophaga fucicola]SFW53850.1 regulator of nucleoside diphosphate kinase [Cellulophaga fucicola]
MKYGGLIIEKKEYVLLKKLMNLSGYHKDITYKKSIAKLHEELKTAIVKDERDMPTDVIRFNSIVTIAAEEGWQKNFQLVKPSDSDLKNNKLSILTPMGTAVIGYAKGDKLLWEFPSGEKTLTVANVEQKNNYIDVNTVL